MPHDGWKMLAQQSPDLFSADGLDETLDRGLHLARTLAQSEMALVHLRWHQAPHCKSWVVAGDGEFGRFHHSHELSCPKMLSLFDHTTDLVVLNSAQTKDIGQHLPARANSVLLAMRTPKRDLTGVLQFVTGGSESGALGRSDLLRAFGSVFTQAIGSVRERRQLGTVVQRYKNFVAEVSEGVWRFEAPLALAPDTEVERQVEAILEHAYLAECNPAMARMYGFENPNEIIGTPLKSLLIPEDTRNVEMLREFVRNGYRLSNAESMETDRQGKVHYFTNNLVGVIENGFLTGAWGTQQEITAFKEMERKLTKNADSASEASRAKTEFLANVSHELRTPLNVILGFADLALDAPNLGEDVRHYISSIRRNGQQLAQILGEVLDLSKIEASRMEIEQIRFPLLPMINEVISFMDLTAREKGLSLQLEKIGALPKVVKTDPTRLRQVLTNLIGNAIKFTEKGGVTVGLRLVTAPKAGKDMQLEFTVSDTGMGISDTLKAKLFQPYSQQDASTSRRFGGTGLGLTLSKQLVHALGGDLRLQTSHVGHGSTFVFTIDAGPFEGDLTVDARSGASLQVEEPRGVKREEAAFNGKRVLVVEDSEDNQLLISRYLAAVGIAVDLASNGFEGMEKAQHNDYDLVLLDIQMPGLDGHQVARNLRERGFAKPIIALTAHAFKEDREKAFASGFNEYLTKPINRSVLLKTLGQRLSSPVVH